MTNAVRLTRDGVDLHALSLSMSLDADSWTWRFSATLPMHSLPELAPAKLGQPVIVQAEINTGIYNLVAEQISRDRTFAQTRIRVSGRGLSALLASPYAPSVARTNTAQQTAHQLMLAALKINGVPLDWAVDFGLADWPVPAGAWSHTGSAIEAVTAIAQAVGGYVQPHDTAQTLRILPRYPLPPWRWAEAVPDLQIPADLLTQEAVEWIYKPEYDRVLVSGQDGGVLGDIGRLGTAKTNLAPLIVDPLITHADAARQRGQSVLAEGGAVQRVTYSLPVLPITGVIKPGMWLRRTEGADSLLGLVRAVSLDSSFPRLRQRIEVETRDAA